MSGLRRSGGGWHRAGRRIRSRLAASGSDDSGFTLIEVIIAIVLVTGLMVSTTVLVVGQIRLSGNNEYAIAAANLANQTITGDETESFSTLTSQAPPSGSGYVQHQTVGTIKYTITTNTYWQPESTTSGGCDNPAGTGSGLADILLVEVAVTWGIQGSDPARADTLITPPVTQGSSSDGNFAIEVEGPAPGNTPLAAVPVQVTGPSGTSEYYTDALGCLFLGYQTPGNYSFAVTQPLTSSGVGWVSQAEQTTDNFGTSTSPVVLAAGQTITQVLNYAQGATIAATFTGASPAPIGLPITIANTSLAPITGNNNSGNGTYTYMGGTTSVTTTNITPVWVYSNGYSVFAGRCPEADPAAVNSTGAALYSSSLVAPTVAVTANSSSAVNVKLYQLTVNVTSTSHASVAGLTAVLNEQAGVAKSACSPLDSYNLATTTPATGTITAGIPLGTFTVTLLKSGSPVMCGSAACTSASFDDAGSASTAAVTIP